MGSICREYIRSILELRCHQEEQPRYMHVRLAAVADNTIAVTRLVNNTVFANMEAFRTLIQHERDNAKEFPE